MNSYLHIINSFAAKLITATIILSLSILFFLSSVCGIRIVQASYQSNIDYPGLSPEGAFPTEDNPPPVKTDPSTETKNKSIQYKAYSGDTLDAVAAHFGVTVDDIKSPLVIASYKGYLEAGDILNIPYILQDTSPSDILIPDSEVVYSPSAADFDIYSYIENCEGFIKNYKETVPNGQQSSAQIIERVALGFSINPRLLLALIEYQSGWVTGKPKDTSAERYPLGLINPDYQGLYKQLSWAAQQLTNGYYGWRDGSLTKLTFNDKSQVRLSPVLNAGTVSLQYFFSKASSKDKWPQVVAGVNGFSQHYEEIFPDPWLRAKNVEPLIPAKLVQPTFDLPFEVGHTWNLTGGPHPAWGQEGYLAAIDFAPVGTRNCKSSEEWVTSVAPGIVVRSETGVVMVDLDGDGREQTGWNILYMHISKKDRVAKGVNVYSNDHIGHPSCEGGSASGTHVHFARKYNGEWILANSPAPIILSGWQAFIGSAPYQGYLFRNGQFVMASPVSGAKSLITR